ncbi:MAG: histidine--tRNA ligase [Mycoplasma sp.]|nr:histidine--tRNA ligase [Mycoplasma sp.]
MYKKVKGTKDIYGSESKWRDFTMNIIKTTFENFNYSLIETPIFEETILFTRGVGEGSDIVNKEMYTFNDKGSRSLTLRPEGTTGTLRALVENKIINDIGKDVKKFYYTGPMFRYERPQKGRYRQFTQAGVEVIGPENPLVDLDVIMLGSSILETLRIPFVLHINFLGSKKTQEKYKKELKKYFSKHKEKISDISKVRLEKNVMRILDSKELQDISLLKAAPKITDFLSKDESIYLDTLIKMLETFEINFKIDLKLVRGLDYYNNTVFEFISTEDESPLTIIGGGRYNSLVSEIGGPDVSGIGFALGFERLVTETKKSFSEDEIFDGVDIFVSNISKKNPMIAYSILLMLRASNFSAEMNFYDSKLNKLLTKANKINSKYVVIVGDEDLKKSKVSIKNLETGKEKRVNIEKIVDFFKETTNDKKN